MSERKSGLWFMAASALAFSAMSALVKQAGTRLPTAEIVCARAAITLVLSYLMVRRAALVPWGTPDRRGSLVLRGSLGFLALACYYWTLGRLPLAEATTVHNTAPIWTAILAWLLLRERLGARTALALALGLAGVLLVARPEAGGLDLDTTGLLVAVAGAICSAMAYVTVRRLASPRPSDARPSRPAEIGSGVGAGADGSMTAVVVARPDTGEHPLVIVFYFPLVALPLSLAWAVPQWETPTAFEWLLLAGIGVTTQIGQVCLTYGLSREPAAKAMAVGYLQVVFAVGWGALVFAEVPPWTTLAGAGLIIGGSVLASRRR